MLGVLDTFELLRLAVELAGVLDIWKLKLALAESRSNLRQTLMWDRFRRLDDALPWDNDILLLICRL